MTRPPAPDTVEQIWRYPVKSLRGERVESSAVDARGLLGDRLWAVRDGDGKLGSGKNSRRFRRFPGVPLLELSARYPVEPSAAGDGIRPPIVVAPDRTEYPVADGSADRFLRSVLTGAALSVVREAEVGHFDEEPVSLIGTATLRWVEEQLPGVPVDARRFRPNLVVRTAEPFAEEAWVGRRVRVGAGPDAVELEFTHVLQRCVMVVAAQADLPEADGMLRMLAQRSDQPLRLAVVGAVVRGGTVRRGDVVHVE
jgi:uncharacterized protein YcbX